MQELAFGGRTTKYQNRESPEKGRDSADFGVGGDLSGQPGGQRVGTAHRTIDGYRRSMWRLYRTLSEGIRPSDGGYSAIGVSIGWKAGTSPRRPTASFLRPTAI